MVQGINSNNYGSITRVSSVNGRAVYQVSDPAGNIAGRISIPEQQCDVFEKSYNDMMKYAPQMQKVAEEYQTPEKQEHVRKVNKWSKIVGASVGLIGSALLTRKMKFIWQALICLPSAVAGLIGGAYVGAKMTTPKGAAEFTQAMQNISKLDVQPYQGGVNG